MSRVAKNPIKIVDGVNVTVEGNLVTVKAVSYTHLTLPTTSPG